jgi:hypothetical protein
MSKVYQWFMFKLWLRGWVSECTYKGKIFYAGKTAKWTEPVLSKSFTGIKWGDGGYVDIPENVGQITSLQVHNDQLIVVNEKGEAHKVSLDHIQEGSK